MKQLRLDNLIFTGRVDVVQYMQKLDFTILTSISEVSHFPYWIHGCTPPLRDD